jgi:uncharacterized damage-inducible protein DinB
VDAIDRLLGHDAWTTRLLLERCRALSDAQMDRVHGIGPGGIRATLDHVVWNMEAWGDVLRDGTHRERPQGPHTVDSLLARLDAAAPALASAARRVRDEGRIDDAWVHPTKGPRTSTLGGVIVHVTTHGMHHRAQVLYMMKRSGLADLPEGDVLTWEEELRAGRA